MRSISDMSPFIGRTVGNASADMRKQLRPDGEQRMYSFMDAKILAKNLRKSLADKGIEQRHGDCLELVARQFGFKDWNRLAARISAAEELASDAAPRLPHGWKITRQTDRSVYRIGLDPDAPGAAQIACRFDREAGIVLPSDSYGCLMQSVDAAAYRGERLVFQAMIDTDDADGAAIWMRVDHALGQALRFDNMLDRSEDGALTGTNDWTARTIVLDVPEAAASVHYGLLLKGHGRMRAKRLTLEPAAADAPVTAGAGRLLQGPTNLGFSPMS